MAEHAERIALGALVLGLCGGCNGETTPALLASATASATAAELPVGTRVVAASGGARYREGKLVERHGAEVTVEHGAPDPKLGRPARTTVPTDQVWPIGAAEPPPSPGDALVCRTGDELWVACRIRSVAPGAIAIDDLRGQPHELPDATTHLVRPDAATRAELDAYLTTEGRHRTFDEAFEAAGAPRRPPGYRPAVGDRVVAHWVGTSYYGATVQSLREQPGAPPRLLVGLRWDGRTFDDQDKPIAEVAPATPAGPPPVAAQFVLLRPASEGGRWEHQRVVRVEGDSPLTEKRLATITDRDARERVARLPDLIPIESPPAEKD